MSWEGAASLSRFPKSAIYLLFQFFIWYIFEGCADLVYNLEVCLSRCFKLLQARQVI